MQVLRAFITLFEALQRSVKIKFKLIFLFVRDRDTQGYNIEITLKCFIKLLLKVTRIFSPHSTIRDNINLNKNKFKLNIYLHL